MVLLSTFISVGVLHFDRSNMQLVWSAFSCNEVVTQMSGKSAQSSDWWYITSQGVREQPATCSIISSSTKLSLTLNVCTPYCICKYVFVCVFIQSEVASLAKQCGLSQRKIQTWFRHRRNQDRPSNTKKFCEASWVFVFSNTVFVRLRAAAG